MIKISPSSPNESLMDNGIQYTEVTKSTKVSSTVKMNSFKESTQKFYLRYYLLIVFTFSNNFLHFFLDSQSTILLIVSISVLVFLVIFSMLAIICAEKEEIPSFSRFFNTFNLLIITGFCLIGVDPNVIDYYSEKRVFSYVSSLQTLILLSSLGYRYSVRSIKYPVFTQTLAIISFILITCIHSNIEKIIYEFLVLTSFHLMGALFMQQSSPSKQGKIVPLGPVVSGVEEITRNIDLVIEKMNEMNENPECRGGLLLVIEELKSIHTMLKNTPNIYSAQLNSVLKGMDEQDKIFIEQACFESCSVSHMASPKGEKVKKGFLENSYGVSELAGVLKGVGKDWNFNTFFINACTNDTPILVIGAYTIKNYGLDVTFEIDEGTLMKFLTELEGKYLKNHYHNSVHGADVMCSLLFLMQNSMLFDHISSLELLASLVSALAHDVGHPGKNNKFMVTSKSDIAILYNDISVLEMMHASILFQILKVQDCNILEKCTAETWLNIRKDVVEMILATDMGKHFELLGIFKAKYLTTDLYEFTCRETRNDLFKLIIKAADIGHAAKSIDLHEIWCGLVIREFFEQGDLEKSLGLPVSMYCDRDTTDVCKSQTGFIKNIVFPLFTSLNTVLSSQIIDDKCVQQLLLNQKYWENQKKYGRGHSLMINAEETSKKGPIFPEIKIRKGSLPEKSFS